MASTPVHCSAWQFPFSSSILSSAGRISSGKTWAAFSQRRILNVVCCCAHEDTDETSARNDFASLGRREALSMVAGVSISSLSSGERRSDEIFNNETRQGVLAGEDGEATLLNNEVAIKAGITSDYMRPVAPSPALALPSLLPSSQNFTASTPSQVYVSLHGPNQMQVSWITGDAGASTVDYGISAGTYTDAATGSSSSYTYGSYTSGNIHYVIIGPLLDDTTYFYRLGGVDLEFSFKTPPPAGADVPINFCVVGDLGQTSNTRSTLKHIEESTYDVLILPGDLSYADGEQPRWDTFGHLVSPLARSRPWMVTQGNHEVENHIHGIEHFRAYNARWKMPHALSGSDSNLFYSFEVAGVHFLMLGSYAHYSQSSDQYKWLQDDLAKVDRLKTPWLIAVLHAPWYNSNFAHQGEGNGMLKAMEDLLFEAKVDIVFAGHVHAYERSVRTYKGKPNKHGIFYINIGDGGNREGLAGLYLPQPKWSAFREASYGHGQLSINDSTTAVWTWHRNQDHEAVVADRVVITSLSSIVPSQLLSAKPSHLPVT